MALDTLTLIDGNGDTQNTPVHLDAADNIIPVHSLDGSSATYAACLTAFAQVATPTVWAVIQGSASKTIRIRRIEVSGAATAYGSMPVVIERCSAAGTLGGAVLTAITAGKHDTANAAATAVVSSVGTANYGVVPTVTAIVAAGRHNFTALGSAATSSAEVQTVFEFGVGGEQALVLRGTSDYITLSAKGAAIPAGGVADLRVVFVEEDETP